MKDTLPDNLSVPASSSDRFVTAFGGLLKMTGGSVLYGLSALSIIYGIMKVMGPRLVDPAALKTALPCLGALSLYELALLATLVFIVVFRRVTDDAVSLVVLIPVFLIGGGVALDTVAHTGAGAALALGAACAVIGIGKLGVLQRVIGLAWGRQAMIGLALAALWSFLAGPLFMIRLQAYPATAADRRSFWLGGLLAILAAGSLFAAGTVRAGERGGTVAGRPIPFLRTSSMGCVFALILFAAAGAHLCAMGYVFSAQCAAGDFLLLVVLGVVLFVEAIRHRGARALVPAAVASCLPMVVVLGGLAVPSFFDAPFEPGLELLGHPAFVLATAGAVAAWLAVRMGWRGFLAIAGAHVPGVVLTAGWSPADPSALNWRLGCGTLAAGLFGWGLVRKRPAWSVAAVSLGTSLACTWEPFLAGVGARGLTVAGAAAALAGSGMLIVAVSLREQAHPAIALIGAAGLAGGAVDFMGREPGWRDLGVLVPLAAAGVVVWMRTRAVPPMVVLLAPVAQRGWVFFEGLSAWRYIGLSFVLLGAGAWLSAAKGRRGWGKPRQEPAA